MVLDIIIHLGRVCYFGRRNIGNKYVDINEKVNFANLDVLAIGQVLSEISADFDRYWNSTASYSVELIATKHSMSLSAAVNTALGTIIESPIFARQLDDMIVYRLNPAQSNSSNHAI